MVSHVHFRASLFLLFIFRARSSTFVSIRSVRFSFLFVGFFGFWNVRNVAWSSNLMQDWSPFRCGSSAVPLRFRCFSSLRFVERFQSGSSALWIFGLIRSSSVSFQFDVLIALQHQCGTSAVPVRFQCGLIHFNFNSIKFCFHFGPKDFVWWHRCGSGAVPLHFLRLVQLSFTLGTAI